MSLQPRRWQPPKATPRAREKHSEPPMPAVQRIEVPGEGPEDVVVAADGRVVAGLANGALVAVDPGEGTVEQIGHTDGRPLGLHANSDGSLLICDAERGLLRLDKPGGQITVLVDEIGGVPLNFTSNVFADGDTVYFTESTRRWKLDEYMGDMLEHSETGRLLRRHPDGRVETLVGELKFANGLVLAPDRSCVLVAETGGYSITRYWLSGDKAGTHDYFVENLPGFPDNMGLGSDGLVWVALVTPRNPLLDMLLPLPGLLRRLVWAIPQRLQPKPARTVWVQAFDFEGNLIHDLQREGTDYAMVTGVAEQDGVIYLGSLTETAIGLTRVP
ncbi:SMP-30/gluconolactonase/LRE family protein [Nocardia sp. CDC160]|uniref:SMP-30/gluconolactonase/LRE family protein n=1 Tax=Nocardia sp. CDC160 TaxID=3112166 RepID=UPI002DBF8FA1|nr:SMP-30/gluconolactonase/LRE family protein [Nocardia sp. CDC160]MEC3914897.1 SMP-30/gluconolactonase/LRE family protein [Nocardia sp. CDC160]